MYCRHCGKTMPDGAVICPSCGANQSYGAGKYCTDCGYKHAPAAATCSKCGSQIIAYPPQSTQTVNPQIGFVEAIKRFYRNYTNIHGRATRAEYWYPCLLFILIGLLSLFIILLLQLAHPDSDTTANAIATILLANLLLALFNFVPFITATIRRLNDTNKSSWWLLLPLIASGIGTILLLIFMLLPSAKNAN